MSSGLPIRFPCGCFGHISETGPVVDRDCSIHRTPSPARNDILGLQLDIAILQKNFPNQLIDVSGGEGGVFVNLKNMREKIDRIREAFEKESEHDAASDEGHRSPAR